LVCISGTAAQALDGALTAYDAQRRLFDALDLAGLIDRSFVFARGNDFKAPRINSTELLTQILIHGLSDAEPWVHEELERRNNLDTGRARFGAIRHITSLIHIAGKLVKLCAQLDDKVIRHS
jgi:hypothetical protein